MLEVKNLCVSYGNTEILHNISFTVPDNNNLVIIGQNGCGKTTLLKAIAGLIDYHGKITYKGIDMKTLSISERSKCVGLMSQFSTMEFDYTVKDVIEMGRYVYQRKGLLSGYSNEDKEIVKQAIHIAGLTGLEKRSIRDLSGGQLQRVYFARAITQQPKILLLDEPTNHLDLKHQAELIDYVMEWSKNDDTMTIGVLHDLNQGMKLGDYCVLLKEGDILAKGKIEDIITKKRLQEGYDMDIHSYMIDSLKRWEQMKHE